MFLSIIIIIEAEKLNFSDSIAFTANRGYGKIVVSNSMGPDIF